MNAPTLNYRLGPSSSGQEGGLDSLIDQTFGSTVGSILYRSSGNWRLLTPGTRGSTLAMGASVPAWLTPGDTGSALVMGANDPSWVAPGSLLDTTFGNTTGAVLYRASDGWTVLAPGTTGTALAMGATIPGWVALSSLLDSVFDDTTGAVLYRASDGWTVLAPGDPGSALVMGATVPGWVTTTANGSELAGTVVVAKIPLTGTVTPGVLTGGSWAHATAAIVITQVVVSVTTVSTGVAALSIGVAADATTSSANLVDALDVNSATLCANNINEGGTLGRACQAMGITQFLNISGSADTTGIVGNVYVSYHLA